MNMCYNNYLSLVQNSSSDNKPVNQIINQQQCGSSDSQMKDFLSGLACLNQPLHQEGQLSMFTAKTSAEYGRRPVINTWRLKERMKTSGVALVICLNNGVDPPDVQKPNPCARKECWIDTTDLTKSKAVESISIALQQQYEKWQSKVKFKVGCILIVYLVVPIFIWIYTYIAIFARVCTDLFRSHRRRFAKSMHELAKKFPSRSTTFALQWTRSSKTNQEWGAVGIRQAL